MSILPKEMLADKWVISESDEESRVCLETKKSHETTNKWDDGSKRENGAVCGTSGK